MIEKMKKLTFLVYHKDYDEFLHRLQDIGVMHVEGGALSDTQNTAVATDMAELRRIDTILSRIEDELPKDKKAKAANQQTAAIAPDDVLEKMAAIEADFQTLDALAERREQLQADVEALTPWGDFDPAYVSQQMQAAGCRMYFFTTSTKVFRKEIEPNYAVEAVSEAKGTTHFVAILPATAEGEAPLRQLQTAAKEVTLPDAALAKRRTELEEAKDAHAATVARLQALAAESGTALEEYRRELQSRMDFDTVRTTTETAADDHLCVLRGWVPAAKEADIQKAFADSSAWFEISDPQPGDDVPVCLKNNRFFRLFEMITELYMLPKYNELDLTPFFAPFYILFFGLCLGDSGYGLFIVLAVLAAKFFVKDMGKGMSAAMNLLLTMGISAFFCGLLSGAFFGFNLYDLGVPFFNKIGNVVALENSQMFNLSLILGFIQIIFGMCLKAYNQTIQFGFRYSLATIGWMLVILSLAATLFLPDYAAIAQWFTYAGLLFAFCYNSPDRYRKNPVTGMLINVGSGLWDAYNTATGMLGDMLSYVRLFALGLSGGILATVFDSLATGLAPDNAILGPIVVVLIFCIGHALNMFMNVLGAFVHPMRLTFVEFFKNAGYEGGGTAYNPFK
ncbi:MAG: V-type ATP synthase subunit I [Bacteroidaceae bacterium]|nr:V-type ATP synthase subunit I [Bacteroidaceae bacterium]MBR1755145.1 V-type ATP synthase subunit I [Bacteroidaceae bacterium]MBR1801545.1 V-type ATP synthase subunit I [Bacteroidaceae bacterium]